MLPGLHHFTSQNSFIGHNLSQLKRPGLKRSHELLWKCCWWGVKWIIPANMAKEHVSELTLQPDLISSLQTWGLFESHAQKGNFSCLHVKPTDNSDDVLSDVPCNSRQHFQFCYAIFTCPALYHVFANMSQKMALYLTVGSCYQWSDSTDNLWTDFYIIFS